MRDCVRGRNVGVAGLALCAGMAASAGAQPAVFEALPEGGSVFATARAISGDGSIVAGDFLLGQFGPSSAGRWVYPGPAIGLFGSFGGQGTSIDAMSRNGLTVYGSTASTAFRWSSPGPMVADPAGRTVDVTPDGLVRIVSGRRQVGTGPLEDLGLPDGYDSAFAAAIDASGGVIIGEGVRVESGGGYVFRGDEEFREAAVWTPEAGWELLGFLPGDGYSTGLRISDDGTVLLGESRANEHGVKRTWRKVGSGPMTDLGALTGYEGVSHSPVDMSADGSVVIGSVDALPARHFVWTPQAGMEDLESKLRASGQDLDSWAITGVEALSADGQYVVGSGVFAGQVREFIAPVFGECAPPTGAVADSYGVVAVQGDAAPGEAAGVTFASLPTFPGASLASPGGAAFIATLSSGSTACFFGGAAVAKIGGAAPGGGTFSSFQQIIANNGAVMLNAVANNGGAVQGLWSRGAGTLQPIVRTGDVIGGQAVQSFLSTPKFNANGKAAFIASFATGFTFLTGTPGGAFTAYGVSTGTVAAFPAGVSFRTPTLCALSDSDAVALTEEVFYAGVSQGADSCVMVRTPGQTTNQVRVLEGQQAPDAAPGVLIGELRGVEVSLNALGRIALTCGLSDGQRAVFAETGAGLRMIAKTGQQVPGEPAGVVFAGLGDAVINDAGTVVFSGVLTGSGSGGESVVFAARGGAGLEALLRTGGIGSGLTTCKRVLTIGGGVSLNNADQVLIPVTLLHGGIASRPALYVHDPARGLVLVAADGEAAAFGVGDSRVLRNVGVIGTQAVSTGMGSACALADDGAVLFMADLPDHRRALVRAVVTPEPAACPTDITGDGETNTADLVQLLVRFGQAAGPGSFGEAADLNGDDVVNTADLVALLVQFGRTCGE